MAIPRGAEVPSASWYPACLSRVPAETAAPVTPGLIAVRVIDAAFMVGARLTAAVAASVVGLRWVVRGVGSAVVPWVGPVPSQARAASVAVPANWLFGTNRTRSSADRNRAAVLDSAESVVQDAPAVVE